ncbi:uncharacterized protein F4807DRAFT_422021 [Annulohypoxylon truncatum]|uniref:uncharacterized protein n=1 Tax=Annulohypoxylon truncatum TaxID=327061 RepID=UPI002007BC2D|nr:uncharacterized protein F4807DRAFT_422021 [Annulohypoxylon truncatum]KAI1210611.1 hypothetical protein F4807DRAFT_422021 [Annulohypoxylon truncatum]
MTEDPVSAEDAAAARAASQASLRKKRREAKIKLGGADRLNKITGLGGGIQRDPIPQFSPETSTAPEQTTAASPSPAADATSAPAPEQQQHGDPEEVDISEHFYKPPTTNRQQTPSDVPDDISDAQLRQLLLGRMGGGGMGGTPPPGANPFMNSHSPSPMPGMEGMEEDPMMKMLQQMMSGGGMPGGGPGSANPFAGTPMEGLMGGLGGLGGGNGMPNPMQQAQQAATNKTANLWRILHAVFALGLGLYVALSTTFTGSLIERQNSTISSSSGSSDGDGQVYTDDIERTRAYFFYVFTSVEAILLTSRYFLDKGREPPKGWMWTVSGFLPGGVKAYVQHALRYGQILGTVRSDALVCVFVLGVCSWLRS